MLVLPDGVTMFNSGYNPSVLFGVPTASVGTYRISVKAKAVQTDKPVTMLVAGGVFGRRPGGNAGTFAVPPGEVQTYEMTYRTAEPGDTFGIMPYGTVHYQNNSREYKGPGLFVGDIEIEGPLEKWPPVSRGKLLGNVNPENATLADARSILSKILPRAFRRPVEADEVEPFLLLVQQGLDNGKSFEQSLGRGLKGILCSPEFLFLTESSASDSVPPTKSISDHAFASRLSYFLWKSLPDETLLIAADNGELRKPAGIHAQIERMLRDPKAERFIEGFTDHWLQLRDIDFTLPDRKLYPEYDATLRRSMLLESRGFFREVLQNNLSLLNFIDSEFLVIDQRMARHYGLDGVSGFDLRRVPLPEDSVRGGVLTQAAVMKVTANGTNTSPVIRGNWVLSNILGKPVPPPPPDIPGVEPDIRGATTIREQLDKHRNNEVCASCHRRIDPPGFALESFDVIGGWRDKYRKPTQWRYEPGRSVDATGITSEGKQFKNIREFKLLLLRDKDQIARCLAEKLLTFAMGRGLGFTDRDEVDEIVANVRGQNYGFRSLVHAVVQSQMFGRE